MLRSGDLGRLWAVAASTDLRLNLVTVVACCSLLAAAALGAWLLQTRPVYLVDFACHRPPDSWKISMDRHVQCTKAMGVRLLFLFFVFRSSFSVFVRVFVRLCRATDLAPCFFAGVWF